MEDWFTHDARDGLTVLSPSFSEPLELFVEGVVPELQRRGLFRTEYESSILPGNLGLPFKPHRHAGCCEAVSA